MVVAGFLPFSGEAFDGLYSIVEQCVCDTLWEYRCVWAGTGLYEGCSSGLFSACWGESGVFGCALLGGWSLVKLLLSLTLADIQLYPACPWWRTGATSRPAGVMRESRPQGEVMRESFNNDRAFCAFASSETLLKWLKIPTVPVFVCPLFPLLGPCSRHRMPVPLHLSVVSIGTSIGRGTLTA